MDPDLLLILPTATVIIVSLGGFLLAGWRMWLRRPRGVAEVQLPDQIDDDIRSIVRDEIAAIMDSRDGELVDLSERIDFAERLLLQSRLPDEQLSREPTPV